MKIFAGCVMLGIWDIWNSGYWGYRMFEVCNVWDVECWGCEMFEMKDIRDEGCWGCEMFEMKNVRDEGCLGCKFFGIWDIRNVWCSRYGMFGMRCMGWLGCEMWVAGCSLGCSMLIFKMLFQITLFKYMISEVGKYCYEFVLDECLCSENISLNTDFKILWNYCFLRFLVLCKEMTSIIFSYWAKIGLITK